MPHHDEELNRRREKRETLRKQRELEARKLRLALIAAALVLIACGVGIFMIARSAGVETSVSARPEETQRQTEATRATETTAPVRSKTTTIHIKAAGDLNITDAVVNAGMPTGKLILIDVDRVDITNLHRQQYKCFSVLHHLS